MSLQLRVRASLCLLFAQYTGGAIGLSTGPCIRSVAGSARPVAAEGPLGWEGNGEMDKVSYHNQTTGTASYPLYSSHLLHT
jgi:hypothetical protein